MWSEEALESIRAQLKAKFDAHAAKTKRQHLNVKELQGFALPELEQLSTKHPAVLAAIDEERCGLLSEERLLGFYQRLGEAAPLPGFSAAATAQAVCAERFIAGLASEGEEATAQWLAH